MNAEIGAEIANTTMPVMAPAMGGSQGLRNTPTRAVAGHHADHHLHHGERQLDRVEKKAQITLVIIPGDHTRSRTGKGRDQHGAHRVEVDRKADHGDQLAHHDVQGDGHRNHRDGGGRQPMNRAGGDQHGADQVAGHGDESGRCGAAGL
ncbi:MAG: hypothetical protein R2742_12610 [Micropruina glycogenica]